VISFGAGKPSGGSGPGAPLRIQQSFRLPQAVAAPQPVSYEDDKNPWGDDDDDNGVAASQTWALDEYIPTYSPQFHPIQKNGLVTGGAAKGILSASGLPNNVLRKIWELSDIDKDGALDLHEFVIAMFITDMVKQGSEVPLQLDADMYPPGKLPH